jgi:uncharacterized protein involved in exopolysaccharide biosynthesis
MSTTTSEARVALLDASPRRADLASRLLLYRKGILRSTILVGLITAAIVLLVPAYWTARASFVAQSGQAESLGQLAGIASQFGVNIANGSTGYSPRFFSALMTSDQVLSTVVDQEYQLRDGGSARMVKLQDALHVSGDTPAKRRQKTINKLRRDVITAIYDQRTGITSFSVRTRSPELSAKIAQVIIQEVNRFNTERHRSTASLERRFVEERRTAVSAELRVAEQRVETFLSQNRLISGSPQRTLELERLKRRADELEQVVDALSRSYERARIEEVRDTPVLTIVEAPNAPVLPDDRNLGDWVLAAVLLTGVLAVGMILALQTLAVLPQSLPGAPTRVTEYVPILKEELRHPWRLVV